MSYDTLIADAKRSARVYQRTPFEESSGAYWCRVVTTLEDCKKNPYLLESVEHVIKDAFRESVYAELLGQREKADFDRISRDCKIQGHHWIHNYGGGMYCSNCALDFG